MTKNPGGELFRSSPGENRQGKDLGGFEGYLEGMFGNPSLAKIEEKPRKVVLSMRLFIIFEQGPVLGGRNPPSPP